MMWSRYKIIHDGDEHIYFIISTIVKWLLVFMSEDHFRLLINSFEYCLSKQEGYRPQ